MIYVAIAGMLACSFTAGGLVVWRLCLWRMKKSERFQIEFATAMHHAMEWYTRAWWYEKDKGDGTYTAIIRDIGVYGYGPTAKDARLDAGQKAAIRIMLDLTAHTDRCRCIPESTVTGMARLGEKLIPPFSDVVTDEQIHHYKQILRNRLAKEA